MKRDIPLWDRVKGIRVPDKAALWIAVFVAFAALCFILLLTLKPLILKLLFLLLGLGAAGYCWVMVESRRISLKPKQTAPAPRPSPKAPAEETAVEAPRQAQTGDSSEEIPQPALQDEPQVFVSDKGDKFHLDRQCVGLRFADSVRTMTREEAVLLKRKPCSKCGPKAAVQQ